MLCVSVGRWRWNIYNIQCVKEYIKVNNFCTHEKIRTFWKAESGCHTNTFIWVKFSWFQKSLGVLFWNSGFASASSALSVLWGQRRRSEMLRACLQSYHCVARSGVIMLHHTAKFKIRFASSVVKVGITGRAPQLFSL